MKLVRMEDRTIRALILFAVLMVIPLSGCLAPSDDPPLYRGPPEGFHVVYEGDALGFQRVEASYTGPHKIMADDGEKRPVYTLSQTMPPPFDWDRVYHFDGDHRLVRFDSQSVSWEHEWMPPLGLLWPVIMTVDPEFRQRENLEVVHEEDTYKILQRGRTYHYERGDVAPFLIEQSFDGTVNTLHRTEHIRLDPMPPVPAWGTPSDVSGERGLLFPGGDEPWFTHPYSYQEQFEGLMAYADSVRDFIDQGGCVDTVVHRPPESRTILGQVGELLGLEQVIHTTEFQVIGPGDGSPESDDAVDGLKYALMDMTYQGFSPYPSEQGERWRVTWTIHPLLETEDAVEYERINQDYVGFMDCAAMQGLGVQESLHAAWDRVQSLPVEWDLERLFFEWRVGYTDHGVSVPERYRFILQEPQDEGPPDWLAYLFMDAKQARFLEFYAEEGMDDLDG